MYPTYVLVALASRNSVFDWLFQNFVLSNAFFMVILSNFEFTIDFVRRNAAYTLYSRRAQLPFRPFLMAGTGGGGLICPIPSPLWSLLVLERPDWTSGKWRKLFTDFIHMV